MSVRMGSVDRANGESPLPPFCKGGNSNSLATSPSLCATAAPRLSSPFAKGGSRGIRPWLLALVVCLLVWTTALPVLAQKAADMTPLTFTDATEEARFHALVSELRCVMCQNQSLADSNAKIAHDLRREVLHLMREGRSDQEVRDFLVERYGEFVLYRPRMHGVNWILWFVPLVCVVGGLVVVVGAQRQRAARAQASAPQTRDAQGRDDRDEEEW